jgi:hypothetical protein
MLPQCGRKQSTWLQKSPSPSWVLAVVVQILGIYITRDLRMDATRKQMGGGQFLWYLSIGILRNDSASTVQAKEYTVGDGYSEPVIVDGASRPWTTAKIM